MNAFTGRVVVLSPHLDDGVLSLGAAIAESAGRADVEVVTVMAGDPRSDAAPGPWDRAAGFASAGEAAGARRAEDLAACERIGARPLWLPFADEQYPVTAPPEEVWEVVRAHVEGADAVLIPGAPLQHQDHRWLHDLLRAREVPAERVGLYLEQPYAAFRLRRGPAGRRWVPPPEIAWVALPASRRSRRRKRSALRCYRSQLRLLTSRPALPSRIDRYESARGGELVGWISRRNR